MSEQDEIILFERIRENIRETQRKLFERKAKLGEPVVVADANGMPCQISGEEALRRMSNPQASSSNIDKS